MEETNEQIKTQCCLPEPDIVGNCQACGGAIYDFEFTTCSCGSEVHRGCKVECEFCGKIGCKACMIFNPDAGIYQCSIKCGG